jgi:predicted metal-dependent HD superfamily phosphohydrolase
MNARKLVSDAWREVVRRHGCDAASAESTLEELVRAYAEPQRHYHTLDHIADILRLLEERGGASDADGVKLAILFHDAVYDPARQDNEAASANLAVRQLSALGFPGQLVGKVEGYVLATQHGVAIAATRDADLDLLLDLDLSVLAAASDRYQTYALAIRREYSAVPDVLYRPGRRRVLEGFLARPQIYRTERLRALWEAPARANLSSEIAALT